MRRAGPVEQAILGLSLCDLRERGNLPEEVLYRLSRASEHFGTWSHVRHDTRLGTDLCAVTDLKMPSQARLAPHPDEVPKHGRTRNADLRDDDAAPAQHNIVADLNQIIETRSSSDYRVLR